MFQNCSMPDLQEKQWCWSMRPISTCTAKEKNVGPRQELDTRALVILPASKGANLHCIGAMTSTTIVTFYTHRGAFRNAECNNWITELIQECASQGIVNPTIINAPANAKLEAAFENTSAEPLWLPPYCYLLLPYSYGTCMERD